jgi:DNA topoisomerase I
VLDSAHDRPTVIDPARAAERIGLRHISDRRPGIGRRRSGKGFRYIRPDGSALSEPHVLACIRALAILPAWT